jgi:hypothetical protein
VEAWEVKVFQRHPDDDPNQACPAEEFLAACPDGVAADLIAIVDAVAESPPPQFTGGERLAAPSSPMARLPAPV